MKHWIITGLIGVFLLGSMTDAAGNDSQIVLNGFSQEVHASDGYEGILGSGARTVSWWYRSHQATFPVVWGILQWGFLQAMEDVFTQRLRVQTCCATDHFSRLCPFPASFRQKETGLTPRPFPVVVALTPSRRLGK